MKQTSALKCGDVVIIAIGSINPKTIEYTVAKPKNRKITNPLYINSPRFKLISKLKEGESAKEFSKRNRKNGRLLTVLEIHKKKWKLTILLRNLLSFLVKK